VGGFDAMSKHADLWRRGSSKEDDPGSRLNSLVQQAITSSPGAGGSLDRKPRVAFEEWGRWGRCCTPKGRRKRVMERPNGCVALRQETLDEKKFLFRDKEPHLRPR